MNRSQEPDAGDGGASSTEAPRNRLAEARSPYLLQHADNPVAWRPWGEEAFREARESDRPLFLSIGYSTCHWCHVMAHESFEDEGVAEILNRHFVPVKVDREERPDVDNVYMTACQMMTGRGGWPLTVVATPEGEPFFAGTYFPKEGRGGRPGLVQIVRRLAEMWEDERDEVLASARKVTSALEDVAARDASGDEPGAEAPEAAYRHLRRTFDEAEGGFGSAPKFPSPHNLLFLLRHGHRTGDEAATEMVRRTLVAMRRGGIWDHVGWGFHRYSTDARWLLPHFEKMLYDQALLALAYTEGWQATGDPRFARTARRTLSYVLRDLRDPAGGFHSAEDADSEGGEGTFYVWSHEELRSVLEPDEFELVREVYNTRGGGNFTEEATGERTGENILHRRRPLAELAAGSEMELGELRSRLEAVRRKLYRAREERPRPHRDDKVLTDWNGLAVAALARAGAVLPGDGGEPDDFLRAAREAADFVLERLRDGDGRLLHRWRGGEAAVPATAEDYAYLVLGLIELYEATLEPRWLRHALGLEEEFAERCWDEEAGGYWFSARDAERLLVRQKDAHDGALPSANGIACWNLRRLARLTGRAGLEERAAALERAFAGGIREAPHAHVGLLLGVELRLGQGREVVVAGSRGEAGTEAMLRTARSGFRPRTVVLHRPEDPDGAAELAELAPFTREQGPVDGAPAAYVCRDFTCREPTTDVEELERRLEEEDG